MAPDNLATTGIDTRPPLPDDLVTRLRASLVSARAIAGGEMAGASEVGDADGRDELVAGVRTAYNRDTLEAIDVALARIDDGTYGTCERCGEAIPVERLEAIPAAVRCVSCTAATPGFLG